MSANWQKIEDDVLSPAMDRKHLEVLRFQLGGLDSLAIASGDLWLAERERIAEVARAFARNRLSNDHLLMPTEGGFVVIVVCGVDPLYAAALGYALGQAIDRFFLDDNPGRAFHVDVTHLSVSSTELPRVLSGMRGIDPNAARRGAISGSGGDVVGQTSFQFQPVWDAKRETVALYFMESVNTATGKPVAGYRFDISDASERPFADIDEVSLRVSDIALHRLTASGRKTMLGVSVHVSTLLRLSDRARIFKTISELDPELLKHRVVRVCGIVPGFPRLYIRDIVQALSARIPHVVISMSPLEEDLASALQCDAWGVSYQLSPYAGAETMEASIRRMAAVTHGSHKLFLIDGDIDAKKVSMLVEHGADMISSPLIWPRTSEPGDVYRWRSPRPADRAGSRDDAGPSKPGAHAGELVAPANWGGN